MTHIDGTALIFGGDGYSQAIDIGDGSIKVKADGSYSFTADNPVIGTGGASATYTVTDGDGDTATAGISFAVTVPTIRQPARRRPLSTTTGLPAAMRQARRATSRFQTPMATTARRLSPARSAAVSAATAPAASHLQRWTAPMARLARRASPTAGTPSTIR
ncbi:hypothetical protein AJ88_13625 [Mesorhizobium amorphae CCBAU 01583]|nr:hypothetical protein AJ88_13625 [Mesorhizobium amorphae CCBAU 01583]